MRMIVVLIALSAGAFAQSHLLPWTSATKPTPTHEVEWGSEGNGGGESVAILIQPWACIYGPLAITDEVKILPGGSICYKGAHGHLHLADFGGGPFFIDDEGYVFGFFIRYEHPRAEVLAFANGVH